MKSNYRTQIGGILGRISLFKVNTVSRISQRFKEFSRNIL